jgi:integrase
MTAYDVAVTGKIGPKPPKHGAGSMGALICSFYQSVEFANLAPGSKVTYRKVLNALVDNHAHRSVRDLSRDKARNLIEQIGATRPGMANLTASVFRRLMSYSVDIGMRVDNPLARMPRYKTGIVHTWSDEELAVYEARWPLGTRERLAYALLLYTGQRGGDVVRMIRSDIKGGVINVTQEKTGTELSISVHPAIDRAIKAGPANGVHLIGDRNGAPISRRTLSLLIKGAAQSAGLAPRCKAHGLRKAIMRRLAEHGAATKELQAVSGHKTLGEIERYTVAASQARLNRAAIERLPDEE